LAIFSTTLAKLVKFRVGKQRSPKFAQIALLKKQQILFFFKSLIPIHGFILFSHVHSIIISENPKKDF
jgi:hypothetical protein